MCEWGRETDCVKKRGQVCLQPSCNCDMRLEEARTEAKVAESGIASAGDAPRSEPAAVPHQPWVWWSWVLDETPARVSHSLLTTKDICATFSGKRTHKLVCLTILSLGGRVNYTSHFYCPVFLPPSKPAGIVKRHGVTYERSSGSSAVMDYWQVLCIVR